MTGFLDNLDMRVAIEASSSALSSSARMSSSREETKSTVPRPGGKAPRSWIAKGVRGGGGGERGQFLRNL